MDIVQQIEQKVKNLIAQRNTLQQKIQGIESRDRQDQSEINTLRNQVAQFENFKKEHQQTIKMLEEKVHALNAEREATVKVLEQLNLAFEELS